MKYKQLRLNVTKRFGALINMSATNMGQRVYGFLADPIFRTNPAI